MRHRKSFPKLGRTSTHRKAMFRNMVTSLLREEKVETTVPKAKEARRVAERMITLAKRGLSKEKSKRSISELHARRQVARFVRDPLVIQKLFEEIGPRFADRPGGYTRILKTGFRAGDNAPLSILEILPDEAAAAAEPEAEEKKGKKKGKAEKEPKAAKSKSKAKGKGKKKAKTKK